MTYQIPIRVNEVRGKKRIAFQTRNAMRLDDEVARSHHEEAKRRYPIEVLEDDTHLGLIVADADGHVETNWVDLEEEIDPIAHLKTALNHAERANELLEGKGDGKTYVGEEHMNECLYQFRELVRVRSEVKDG